MAASLRRDPISSAGADDEVIDAYRRIWRHSVFYQPHEQDVLAWVFAQALDTNTKTGRPAPAGEQCRFVTA